MRPICPHFGVCGGCKTQDWDPQVYREWKRGLVVDALRRRGIETEVAPLVDAHGTGRRRAVLHVRRGPHGPVAGFMAAKSHDLVAIDHCPVLDPALDRVAAIARQVGAYAGECDCAFTLSDTGLDLDVKAERKRVEKLGPALAALAHDHRLARIALNGETVIAREAPRLGIGKASVKLPVLPFLQATTAGETALANFVTAKLAKAKHIADLFCGMGPFALRLADFARVHALDNDAAAIAALAEAARNTQGLKPIAATKRDLFREPLTSSELKPYDALVFDPPRAGTEAQCRALAKSGIPRIAAISCDPTTFARDAAILISGGYALSEVNPLDQFRHTQHVEIAALFER